MKLCLLLCCAAALQGAAAAEVAPPEGYELKLEQTFDTKEALAAFDFTDPKAWGFEADGENGALALKRPSKYSPPVRSPLNIAWIKDLELEDFILDVRARQTGREYGHRDLCLFFGGVDESHFYYVHLATVADAHANSIFIVDGAPRLSIAEERTDGTKWSEGYHHIRIVRGGKSGLIEVFFDDMEKPVMKALNRQFVSGRIGLGSFDDVGLFDDLRVYTRKTTKE